MTLLLLAAAVWAARTHFHLVMTRNDFYGLEIGLGAMLALRLMSLRRGGLMAEFFSLSLVSGAAICVLSYLCMASAGPLVDGRLRAMDQVLGFDWLAGYRFLHSHASLAQILRLAYYSLIPQGLYFCILMAVMNRKAQMREMLWLVLLTGLCACTGVLLLPAMGPFQTFGIVTSDSFLPTMHKLAKGDLNFALAHMTGVVSFPSFHTAMALGYVWGFRNTGPVGWVVAALNVVMLTAVPFFGGHYLVDMIAGAASMLLALGLIKTAPLVWGKISTGYALPESAAVYGDAYSGSDAPAGQAALLTDRQR